MYLCLDVGNTHMFGGVYDNCELVCHFRKTSTVITSDELGIFLQAVLRAHKISPSKISQIAISSVVPPLDYSLRSACLKYFSLEPYFVDASKVTSLKILYNNAKEVGADLIAGAIAGTKRFPGKNLLIIDFGTATTYFAVDKNCNFIGGAILAGMRLCVEALASNTSKLSGVEIKKVFNIVGSTTAECIQSGLYFGMLGATQEIIKQIKLQHFYNEDLLVIATGGFASLFTGEKVFDHISPDLVLYGIYLAATQNFPPIS